MIEIEEENPGRKERKGPRAGETEQGRIKGVMSAAERNK